MEKVNVLKIETQEAQTSIKQLRKELMEMKNQMANLEEGGEEFVKVANKAGELKHQIDEINQSIKGASSDMGDMIGNATTASAGLVGAFQAVEGALHLMGVESEAVTEAIAKMQSLMAITQGLASIDDGIKAFGKLKTAITMATVGMSGFKKALIGTGIGALIVALGTLIAYWDDVAESLGFVNEQQERNNQLLLEAEGAVGRLVTERKRINKLQAEQGQTEEEIINSNIEAYTTQLESQKKGVKNLEGWVNTGKKLNEEQQKALETYKNNVIKLEDEIAKERQKLKDLGIKKENEEKQLKEKRIEEQKKSQEEEVALFEIGIDRKVIKQGEEYTATYEYIQEMLKLYAMKKQMYKDDKIAYEQTVNEELAFIEENIPKVEELQTQIQGVTVSTNPKEEALKDLDEFAKKVKEKNNEVQTDANKTAVSTYDSFSNTVAGMNYVASSFTSILGTLSAQQDTNTKEGFEMQKKLNISTATINGLMGILNAWVSAMSPSNAWMTIYGQIAMGAAQSIAMATMMGVQIDAIKKQSFGGGSSTSSASMPNVSSIIAMNQPQFTQDVNGASIEQAINQEKHTKVYVLESDITSTQNKVEVARSENVY